MSSRSLLFVASLLMFPLAVTRMVQIVLFDVIFGPVRKFVDRRAEKRYKKQKSAGIWYAFSCSVCMSVWCGLIGAGLLIAASDERWAVAAPGIVLLLALAGSESAIIIDRIVERSLPDGATSEMWLERMFGPGSAPTDIPPAVSDAFGFISTNIESDES